MRHLLHKRRAAAWYLTAVWLLTALLGAIILALPEARRRPLVAAASWEILGGFAPMSVDSARDLPRQITKDPDAIFWSSWTPDGGPVPASLRSGTFTCDAPALSIPTAGYPSAPGNSLKIERVSDGAVLCPPHGNLHEHWQEVLIPLPEDWRETPLRLVVESKGQAYIRVGTPFSAGSVTMLKRSVPVVLAIHAAALAWLALAAMPAMRAARKFLPGAASSPLILAPVALAVSGMAIFYLSDAWPFAGIALALALPIAGLFLARRDVAAFARGPVSWIARRGWLHTQVLTGAGALALSYAQPTLSPLFHANYRFMPASWSTDNQLPVIVGEYIAKAKSTRELKFGTWRASDRPPALAGAIAGPVAALDLTDNTAAASRLGRPLAHVVGVALLSSWIMPAWWLLGRAGWRARKRRAALLLLSATPFVFFNTLYIWPKLWSATLALCGWALLHATTSAKGSVARGAVAGFGFAGALLAHGSAFFGLLGVAATLAARLSRKTVILYASSAAVFAACVLGWTSWVKTFSPPGNSLAKKAFAGTFDFENPGRSLGETTAAAYGRLSLAEHARRIGDAPLTWLGLHHPLAHEEEPEPGNWWRRGQFLFLVPALGLLVVPLFAAIWKQCRSVPAGLGPKNAPSLLTAAILSLLIQGAVMWDTHIVHHTAYSTVLILHLGAIIGLGALPALVARLVGWGVLLWFFAVWMASPLIDHGWTRFPFAAAAMAGAAIWLTICAMEVERLAPKKRHEPSDGRHRNI